MEIIQRVGYPHGWKPGAGAPGRLESPRHEVHHHGHELHTKVAPTGRMVKNRTCHGNAMEYHHGITNYGYNQGIFVSMIVFRR